MEEALAGDTDAMVALGTWYSMGSRGLELDWARSYGWFKLASDRGDARGSACAAFCLLWGKGAQPNPVHGTYLLGRAAEAGSDLAAYVSGCLYDGGLHGMPEDAERARHWYDRVVGGTCEVRHLAREDADQAAVRLREMEERRNRR